MEESGTAFHGAFASDDGETLVFLAEKKNSPQGESWFIEVYQRTKRVGRRVRAEGTVRGVDMVRHGDCAYVASNDTCSINVYNVRSLRLTRSLKVSVARDSQLRSIAISSSFLSVLVSDMRTRDSSLHTVDKFSGNTLSVADNFGRHANGIVLWKHYLLTVSDRTLSGHRLGRLPGDLPLVFWRVERRASLVGLCVVRNMAFVGVSSLRTGANPIVLVAIDLVSKVELFRRPIAAYQIHRIVSPTYLLPLTAPVAMPLESKPNWEMRWQSIGGPVDISPLRDTLSRMWSDIWRMRKGPAGMHCVHEFAHLFKSQTAYNSLFQGVKNAKLMFDIHSVVPFQNKQTCRAVFPLWHTLSKSILPILEEVFRNRLGIQDYLQRLLQVQLNLMGPSSRILPHADSGNYALAARRYHVPLFSSPCVRFEHLSGCSSSPCWKEIPYKVGEVFEVNNLVWHRVENAGHTDRLTLLVDLLDTPTNCTVEVHAGCKSLLGSACHGVSRDQSGAQSLSASL